MTSYQHARAAAHFAMAGEQELHDGTLSGDAVQAALQLPFPGETASQPPVEMPGWEFELDEEFDIVEQISEPDWSDVAVDNLSCRLPGNDNTQAGPPPDPHEFDLPLCLAVVAPALADTLFSASQQPPSPAPVFRADRPPSLTA
ncbi:hypothetical protein [Pigmentiphaga sp. NML080357]|uniref:hypothetical protein n=1 Tax=Pigmentiphaga sp. NML080357 TaxID=2008675 RepID=UPI0011858088|nr:hypothetical protein [Pigmentiphaga sp. NML080357]